MTFCMVDCLLRGLLGGLAVPPEASDKFTELWKLYPIQPSEEEDVVELYLKRKKTVTPRWTSTLSATASTTHLAPMEVRREERRPAVTLLAMDVMDS